jgi:cysteinyl-tRNA synthetase
VRYLRAHGLHVTYVRNFTDIDDKIIDRAQQLEQTTETLAQTYIDAFYEDMDKLGVLRADHEPKATDHIRPMIEMIMTLIEKGFAYEQGGNVFYSVEAFKGYGELSGRRLEDMKAGSRIEVDRRKRHPMDFVLWKGAKKGEPQWPSPWGPGRPGWHMECSVMSNHFLGSTFDIHGGGKDLLFPHHENERAQSIAAKGGQFARYWVHNGFVTVESEKMSKSLGNFLTIRDALDQYHPEVLRLFLLSKHYRSPLDFSKSAAQDFQLGLTRIYRTLLRLEEIIGKTPEPSGLSPAIPASEDGLSLELEQFTHIMDDDLNTAGAIGYLFERVKEFNRIMDSRDQRWDEATIHGLQEERRQFLLASRTLGLLETPPEEFFRELASPSEKVNQEEIEAMIAQRTKARLEKNWALADDIRDRLEEMGVLLEDTAKGTTWRYHV